MQDVLLDTILRGSYTVDDAVYTPEVALVYLSEMGYVYKAIGKPVQIQSCEDTYARGPHWHIGETCIANAYGQESAGTVLAFAVAASVEDHMETWGKPIGVGIAADYVVQQASDPGANYALLKVAQIW